jgi:hypothetical protein
MRAVEAEADERADDRGRHLCIPDPKDGPLAVIAVVPDSGDLHRPDSLGGLQPGSQGDPGARQLRTMPSNAADDEGPGGGVTNVAHQVGGWLGVSVVVAIVAAANAPKSRG